MKFWGLVWAGAVGAAVAAEPVAPTFTTRPRATREGGKVKITFAVSGPTDVAVFVEDAAGKVVRHLAAGVLGGENPPPQPLKAGLAQDLVWDGADDLGRPAGGDLSACQVRVALGMKPQFDGFLLYNRDGANTIDALAVGPQGRVVVFYHTPSMLTGGGLKVNVLDREGRHVRTLVPFAADIPPERIRALAPFQTADGDLVPQIHGYHQCSFYPLPPGIANGRSASTPDVFSPAVDGKGRVYWLTIGPHVACVDAKGGVPYETFLGPRLFADIAGLTLASIYTGAHGERPCLAVSGDDKWLYVSGLRVGDARKKADKPIPCVFRVNLETRGPAEVFLGRLDAPGTGEGQFVEPRGLAVADGLLYVADAGADPSRGLARAGRVVVFKEADRSRVGEVAVEAPDTVGVDPATGAVYVVSGADVKKPDLVKFDDYRSGREVCRLSLPQDRHAEAVRHRIAVDASAKPIRLWLPGGTYWTPRFGLLSVEDAGEKFVSLGDPRSKALSGFLCYDMTVDRPRSELYVKYNGLNWYRLDERTGAVKDTVSLAETPMASSGAASATQLAAAPDGSLYTWSWKYGLRRFDRNVKPLNWPGQETSIIPIGATMSFQTRQLAVTRDGRLLVVMPHTYASAILKQPGLMEPAEKKRAAYVLSVNRLGFDGRIERTVVWGCANGAVLRTDAQGNVYLADGIRPAGRSYPEFFDGKLKTPPGETRDASFWTSYMYGSIVKFPPSGGAIWYEGDYYPPYLEKPPADLLAKPRTKMWAHLAYQTTHPAELQGALWCRFGFAPFTTYAFSGGDVCMCEGPGFDVDAFGRVFYPNSPQFRVEVVDANNNRVGLFGKYGNEDSGGTEATVRRPDIPLAWPMTVAVSDTHAYVGDRVSQRVVRVKLAYAAESTCTLAEGGR